MNHYIICVRHCKVKTSRPCLLEDIEPLRGVDF